MIQSDFLWDKLATLTPYFCIFKLFWQVSMDLLTNTLDWATISVICQNNWISPIRLHVRFFGVYSDEIELLPDFFKKAIKIKFQVTADDNCTGLFCEHIDFFQRNSINFVVTVKTFDKLSVSWVKLNNYLQWHQSNHRLCCHHEPKHQHCEVYTLIKCSLLLFN